MGGWGWRGTHRREEGRRRALPAGLGWSALKREGREEGPRRAERREGFLKPKINKLFLFTCGVGGGSEPALRPPLPHTDSLSPPALPSTGRHWHHPWRSEIRNVRVATESTRRGRPAPGSVQPVKALWGKRARSVEKAITGARNLATRWGEGVQTPFPSFRPPPPPLPGKKAREPWRGDKRKDSTLGVRGGIGPFLPLALKPLAAHPPANPPTRPFKAFLLPAFLHSSTRYPTQESWWSARWGQVEEEARGQS